MNIQFIFLYMLGLLSATSLSQTRSFSFNTIQSRNSFQQWEIPAEVEDRTVKFTEIEIDLTVDKPYHLSIVAISLLPNHGIIYRCKDEQSKDITIMLIAEEKMFLYDDERRFQINFSPNPHLDWEFRIN